MKVKAKSTQIFKSALCFKIGVSTMIWSCVTLQRSQKHVKKSLPHTSRAEVYLLMQKFLRYLASIRVCATNSTEEDGLSTTGKRRLTLS